MATNTIQFDKLATNDASHIESLFERLAEHDKRASSLTLKNDIAKKVERLADQVLQGEERAAEYQGKGIAGLRKFYERSAKNSTKEAERLAVKTLREIDKFKNAAARAEEAVQRDQSTILKELSHLHADHIKVAQQQIETLLKGHPEGMYPNLYFSGNIGGVNYNIPSGPRDEVLSKLTDEIVKKHDEAVKNVERFAEKAAEKYEQEYNKIEYIVEDIEKATKKTAKELLGKTEATVAKTLEKETSKIEHAVEEVAEKGWKTGAAIGVVAGGIAGNMMSSEENKTQNTVIGAGAGGIIGGIIQHWNSAKAALGGVMHGPRAEALLQAGMKGASRF